MWLDLPFFFSFCLFIYHRLNLGRKPAQARRSGELHKVIERRDALRDYPPSHSARSPVSAGAPASRDTDPPSATTIFSPLEKTPDCSEIKKKLGR
jgi:hypothetical protein